MSNIKQKFLKFIISFACIVLISACSQTDKPSARKNIAGQKGIDVAIVLPLSGPEAALGKEYAQMIKLGLSDGAKTKIRVTTYDSSNPETLSKSLDKILEDGVDIIIGPVYSEETKAVAEKVKGKGTIVISLSNNPVLADKQTYVFGHAPMRQLEQITNYFLEKKHQNYITLLPAGRYSNTISKILKDMITSKGAALARLEFYGTTPEDLEKSLRLVSDTVDTLNENDYELTRPVILLADDQSALETLLKHAQKFSLDKKAILAGDSRIDLNFSEPITTTFTGSLNIVNFDLPARSAQLGIKHISFIHTLAYDAGRLVGNSIGSNYSKTKFVEQLNSAEPFHGASGAIGFVDSIAQRKYDIIKKENGQYKSVSNEGN
ncbi:Type 1 periplasmic binding fold superfamily protein [Candidatus Megaera venefica]|uniref:Type 1 periplasmic binding fold superfamily protein n=1 Tax=Candidatus Megaera venefica TaxID=2055910 RepID=A0ABU5NAM6_9RICK|nr:penicillin-binding protein activator [Candidatus Megaera venefica]MEA0970223.1 Type 1 periplasmic binding fold superfamily protein [Candidatus Megaera venefica]